jgi:trehalose-6-phosphatase
MISGLLSVPSDEIISLLEKFTTNDTHLVYFFSCLCW